jgi:hypothetical protein
MDESVFVGDEKFQFIHEPETESEQDGDSEN